MKTHWAALAAGMMMAMAMTEGAAAQPAGQRFAPLTEDRMTAEQKAIPSIRRALEAGKYNPNGFDAVLARNPGLQDAQTAVAVQVYPMVAQASPGGRADPPTISPALTEIAILLLSQHWDFPAMFKSHGPLALKEGISQATLDALAKGERPAAMTPAQAAVYDFTAELVRDRAVSDATFARTRRVLSERDIVDLVGILGVYTNSLMMLKAADIASH